MYLCKFMLALATVLIKLAWKLGAGKTDPTVQNMRRHFLPYVFTALISFCRILAF